MLGWKSDLHRQRIRENGTVYDLDVKKGRPHKTRFLQHKNLECLSVLSFFLLVLFFSYLFTCPGAQASKLRRALPEDGHDRRLNFDWMDYVCPSSDQCRSKAIVLCCLCCFFSFPILLFWFCVTSLMPYSCLQPRRCDSQALQS